MPYRVNRCSGQRNSSPGSLLWAGQKVQKLHVYLGIECQGVVPMFEPLRSLVQKDGTVSATCPSCGAVQTLESDAFRIRSRSVKVKCPCGTTFTALAEFRKAYRREVNLSGTYANRSSGQENKRIRIKNLSMTGVGFAAGGDQGLSTGDELIIRMVFDKSECPELEVVAEVVYVLDEYAGCRFKEMSPQQEETLASYLVLIP